MKRFEYFVDSLNLYQIIDNCMERKAASALKNAEGLLTLVVAKPTKTSLQEMISETESPDLPPSGECKKELSESLFYSLF